MRLPSGFVSNLVQGGAFRPGQQCADLGRFGSFPKHRPVPLGRGTPRRLTTFVSWRLNRSPDPRAVMNEDGTKVAEIELDAHPESFQLENNGPRLFVNLPKSR